MEARVELFDYYYFLVQQGVALATHDQPVKAGREEGEVERRALRVGYGAQHFTAKGIVEDDAGMGRCVDGEMACGGVGVDEAWGIAD